MAEKVAAKGEQSHRQGNASQAVRHFPAAAPIIDQVRQIILSTPSAGIVGSLKGMASHRLGPLLPKISVPVLDPCGRQRSNHGAGQGQGGWQRP